MFPKRSIDAKGDKDNNVPSSEVTSRSQNVAGCDNNIHSRRKKYETWIKNCPFLYDFLMTDALEWPSLTCQWLPKMTNGEDEVQRLILGKCSDDSSDKEQPGPYDRDHSELGGFSKIKSRIKITMRINHEGEVNKARYMPQNPCLIATRTARGDVLIFEITRHSAVDARSGECCPELRLRGHTKEGYGLSWNPNLNGHLLTSSDDQTICLWNVNKTPGENRCLFPETIFRGHSSIVEDVAWHQLNPHVFGSVGDDRKLLLWDIRRNTHKPFNSANAHEGEVNCISFSPFSEYIITTGGSDETVALWDMRYINIKLHKFEFHRGEIFQVKWSPHHETIFATSSTDHKVAIWDLSRIGSDKTKRDEETGPPELIFIHSGHDSMISDFNWNTQIPWMFASVSEDNIFQMWQVAEPIYENELFSKIIKEPNQVEPRNSGRRKVEKDKIRKL
ncbi:hypothetical protein GJ496_007529 [Pomphorhynchus laevis]|nr:hypothetical protein GJ496_007529 [Pomphorhynchus laevis]